MNNVKRFFVIGFWFFLALCPASVYGQTLEGVWEGNSVSVNRNAKIPPTAAYRWDKGGWNFTLPNGTWSSYSTKLDIQGTYRNLTGNYSADDKLNPKNSGHYAFSGNFNFEKKLMVWQPEQKIGGKTEAAKTIIRSLTYSYQDGDDYEYLKGRWASTDGFTGIMEFRRKYSGTPLKDDHFEPDFVAVETGGEAYVIQFEGYYLELNQDRSGVLSTKRDDGEHAQKWKFEPAPKQFPKSYRIVPVGKENHCLQIADEETGTLAIVDNEDKPDGEQFWRFERNGDGVLIVNFKLGGRALEVNKDDGETILRSRNETHDEKWKLEKQ
ncbi:MAG: RICIN domain-containing protein [Blastocatellia bacterium]|nr:RICIN domain-containing protein [Blastocatellia bacterium]